MPRRVLIVPDKFKGTLSAHEAAKAIARGWKQSHPKDLLTLLPMCDGGEGFGEIISRALGASKRSVTTIDAAGRPLKTNWWWAAQSRTAVIESSKIIGLAMLPAGTFHPFQLNTFGLGKVFSAAQKLGARHCLIGIGGSATNDAGFGVARALGWKFLDANRTVIEEWTKLNALKTIVPPPERLRMKITVAVDVQNPLLGAKGATRVYGPQKGLRGEDFHQAENALSHLAKVTRQTVGRDVAKIPGAGAAGGLGFGLMAFLHAKPESGFEIFSRSTGLKKKLAHTYLVLTGEGALDRQTLMGKGVGQVALLCKKMRVPCIGFAGVVTEPKKAGKLFSATASLLELTDRSQAMQRPAEFLEKLAAQMKFIPVSKNNSRGSGTIPR